MIELSGFAALYIFMLAAFTGYEVIAKVPAILHTPLMSGSNFVHGIVVVGAMVALGHAEIDGRLLVIGFIGVLLGAGNAVGGYVVTERMLEMFKSSLGRRKSADNGLAVIHGSLLAINRSATTSPLPVHHGAEAHEFAGDRRRAASSGRALGMVVATLITFLYPGHAQLRLDDHGHFHRRRAGLVDRQAGRMTDMPQMIALYNGMGGGAAAAISPRWN